MTTNDIEYMEEAAKVLSVPVAYLESFTNFIINLDDEKLHMLLSSSQTTITENISKFLYNLHYHKMVKLNNDEGGLNRFSEDEIARLAKYVNNVAEKINHIRQGAKEEVVPVEEVSVETEKEEIISDEKNEVVEELSPESYSWIERGKKIVLEEKRRDWENYVRKSQADKSPLKPNIDAILKLMEAIKESDTYENVANLTNKRNYSIYMYSTLREAIKEFLGIDIEEYQQAPESVKLKPAKKEKVDELSNILAEIDVNNMTDFQKEKLEEVKQLTSKKQEKEKELDEAEKELETLRGQYRIKNNAYRAATYGIKARNENQIMTEQNRINGIFAEAKSKEKEAKRDRNKQLLKDIFSKADTEKGEKKGFFGSVASNWEKTKNDYEESIQRIREKRDDAISRPEEEIKKNNGEIEKARNELRSLGTSIKEQDEKVKDISNELYEIKLKIVTLQRLLEKSDQPGLLERPIKKEEIDLDR